MSNTNTYLFALTITPVQSFISQARTTKDLFAGSKILSLLMKQALEELRNETIIFPQNKESVSNKLVARLDNIAPKELGDKLEKLIHNELYIIGSKALLSFPNIQIKTQFLQEHFKPQLCEFFQVFWVAVEFDGYKASYKKLEQNLRAVKNLRQFKQLSQESGQKCSVCGERNGLFYNNDKKPKRIIQDAIRISGAQIKESETLCAVCFTKRAYKNDRDGGFPSLADIVVFNKNPKPQDAEKFLEENPSEEKRYALLHFDVDSLGKKLSELDEKGQRELSEKLGEFAANAKKIVDGGGKTVYAGGDDFLGFVNLADLPDTICEIKNAFNIEGLTFSASIVIAHYKAPLHKVLDFSRELLDSAKRHFDDKNGIGIMVMNSNAIVSQTICRYEDFKLLDKLKKAEIAKNIHFKLHTTFDYLGAMSYDEYMIQKEMIGVEIKRLMKRENGDFDQKLYDELIGFLGKQYKELAANSYKIDFDNFIGYLKTLEQLRGAM